MKNIMDMFNEKHEERIKAEAKAKVEEPTIKTNKNNGTYEAQLDGKRVVTTSLDSMKAIISEHAHFKIVTDWSLMIILQKQPIGYEIKFFGLISESGKSDKIVVSDPIQNSPNPDTWSPGLNYKEFQDSDNIKVIPYKVEYLQSLDGINQYLHALSREVFETIFSPNCTKFLEDFSKNRAIIKELV